MSVAPDRVLAAGTATDETIVALRREANPTESAAGGKAAQIWIARGRGPFYQASDYISYDFACWQNDAVCEELRPTGIGMFVVHRRPGGRAAVLVQTPPGRRVEVVAQGRSYPVASAEHGAVVEVKAPDPYAIQVHVFLPDGRRYQLPHVPGAVITD